jgi:membrane-bound serine protease (ClpP class)
MRRLLYLLIAAAAVLMLMGPALAQSEPAGPPVLVADVRGPLDQRALDFLEEAVRTPDVQLVVLQINNAGISSGDPTALYAAVAASSVPVAVWVGPAGAVAYGGAGQLLLAADATGAAPGTRVGFLEPVVIRAEVAGVAPADAQRSAAGAIDDSLQVTEDSAPALIDAIVPTIGQFIASLDGRTVGGVTLETAREVAADDGSFITVPSVEVRFVKPGLVSRFFRLASRPEAAFFFLLAGVAVATFEFYAAGAGVAAAVAALSLFLAGYGWATLPMNWFGVALALFGLLLYTWEFQQNRLGIRSVVGTAALLGGGFFYTSAAPQYTPAWWGVVITVIGIALFYGFALTTVVRSRFSTLTIGREYLVGKQGIAETDFDPEGVVVVDGARWRARSHRAAGLGPGDAVEVLEVNGILLEVGPPE